MDISSIPSRLLSQLIANSNESLKSFRQGLSLPEHEPVVLLRDEERDLSALIVEYNKEAEIFFGLIDTDTGFVDLSEFGWNEIQAVSPQLRIDLEFRAKGTITDYLVASIPARKVVLDL